jgi:hypothetical protein
MMTDVSQCEPLFEQSLKAGGSHRKRELPLSMLRLETLALGENLLKSHVDSWVDEGNMMLTRK